MNEIIAKVLSSKKINLSNKKFGNKYDNGITKVIFNEIEDNANLLHKYAAFLSPSSQIFLFPLNSLDNSFIVSTTISKEPGAWRLIYLSTNQEITEGKIDENYKVYVSEYAEFTITDNFITDVIEEPIIDPNLNIIYEQLEQTIIYLNSDDFKNELLQNFKLTEQNINQITTTLKSDETFKQELKGDKGDKGDTGEQGPIGPAGADGKDGDIGPKGDKGDPFTYEDFTQEQLESLKGPKGDTGEQGPIGPTGNDGQDGKSSYQSWLDLGNVGTEEDFINSLKGDKGDTGEQGPEGPSGSNGNDGFSPTITKTTITNGTRLTITDKTQTQTVDVLNGSNYTITSSDYDEIADVVLTKMTNADNVSY